MPEAWVRALGERELGVEAISARFQVPPCAVVTRLAELGLPVPEEE